MSFVRAALAVVVCLPGIALPGQDGVAARVDAANQRVDGWRGKLRRFAPELHWLPDGQGLVYQTRDGERDVWVRLLVDGSRTVGQSKAEVGLSAAPQRLTPRDGIVASGPSQQRTEVRFVNETDRVVRLFWSDGQRELKPYGEVPPGESRTMSTFAGHAWVLDHGPDQLVGVFVAESWPGIAVAGPESQGALQRSRRERREGRGRAFVREHNVWLRGKDGEELPMTEDGTAADGFVGPLRWSPDGARALVFRRVPGERRQVTLVESSPQDQLQPKVHVFDYRKPGDRIDVDVPYLVDVGLERVFAVDAAPFADAWSIDRVRWSADSGEVYCLYNQRGHQVLRVLAIDAASGAVGTVLEEKSATFVDYSQKTVLHWLGDGREFLWASERDGHNHLYVVDARSGAMRQLTKGPWVVRAVERVDEAAGQVWIKAYGIHPDQDPYHAHLVRVPLEGGDPVVLTSADGTHEWTFSPDRSLFVARWSRVDQPWVSELRRASDGSLVAELGRDDASALLAAGWQAPVRFVAKGRDGTTDIHGILHLPAGFAPGQRYPVVEDIYAGPHGHHVPKTFGLGERQRRIAELGMVVVQIDGMGTNWRSKAFHDVCWRNLKDGGFPDRILWIQAAAAKFAQLDTSKVGIFGGSAGGQNALAALLHHGEFYKAAVADCGCHDNRMDKIWWNEAWMGYPIGPWYAESSNVVHAGKLRGRLLLTVGELDRNVDPASTMQVVDALLRAGKEFECVVVPGGGHGVGETAGMVRKRMGFFVTAWL